MTFKEKMIEAMTARGMFESQAILVMETIIETNAMPDMEARWYEETHAYPEELVAIIWINVREIAYKWIEENYPLAWFKPMFQYSENELAEMIKEKEKQRQKSID